MPKRVIYDQESHAQFVTFSCYRRRRLLDDDQSKRCVLGALNAQLRRLMGKCVGFVVMPDHVHAILWFAKPGELSEAMKQWKRTSGIRIKELFAKTLTNYGQVTDQAEPTWQAKYHTFNLYSRQKIEEKLSYMHLNPVRAGLVAQATDWRWSSARWYEEHRTVGVPITWPE
ncbi:MAG: transposase [Planctomycetes bacterium]|nr:transposase [Planctomycetota bacterium]